MAHNGNGATVKQPTIEQIVPHSREAEQSVIGSLLIDPDALLEVIGWLQPEHFYIHDAGKVYGAMIDLHRNSRPHNDIVELSTVFDAQGDETIRYFMMDCINEVPTSVNVKYYAETVRERATRRLIINTCTKGATLAYQTENNIDEVVSSFQADVFKATMETGKGELESVKASGMAYLEKLETARQNPQALSGLSTGLSAVDAIIGGLKRQDVIILAAATSMGKTAGAITIADNLTKAGYYGAFFSLEMAKEQIINRFISMRVGIEWEDLQRGNLTDAQMSRVYDEMGRLADSNLYIDDTPALTPEQIMARARKLAMTRGLDYIVVDYLGLVSVPEAKGNSYAEISLASRRLKTVAKSLNVPMIVPAQISRSNVQRGDKRPTLTDLRDSGKIEEDADVVCFIYRDGYYNENTLDPNVAEWIIRKNRTGGRLGTARTFWKSNTGQFCNLASK